MTLDWKNDVLFSRLIRVLLEREGGYVNDPDDTGGETKYGISRKSYPDLDIKGLSREDATAIYYRDFWLPHPWRDLPGPLAERTFLLAAHAGYGTAARVLQRALRSSTGFPLRDDGQVGPRTKHLSRRANVDATVAAFRSEQAGHYRVLFASGKASLRFRRGWLLRAYDDFKGAGAVPKEAA